MNTYSLARNLMTGAFFIAGILSFVSREFILSTTLFGMSALANNIRSAKPSRA
ncbi:MAG: hypothetical protein ACU836_11830 [Gammaproteobacteria bacterium]